MSTTCTPTHIIPKVYCDKDDVFTFDVTDNEELPLLCTTEWTCIPSSGKCEIVYSREVYKYFCDLVHHFDNSPTVKLASLHNPEQKVTLVLRHDTRESALEMMCKLTDVKDTVVTFLRHVKIPADDIKVSVQLKGLNKPAEQQKRGLNKPAEQQNGGGTCLFESTPDCPKKFTSETTWMCTTDAGFKVADGETSQRHFSKLKDAMRDKYRACLKCIRSGSVNFFVHHETTQDALEMTSHYEEVMALILTCLQGIDSTVKDIQMDVQLQDFIAWSEREARRLWATQKSVQATIREGDTRKSGTPSRPGTRATPTPPRRDPRADADLHDACRKGNLAEVKRILDTGRADVNCRGMGGRTPVMEAAWRRHRVVVEFLVSQGADVSLVDDDGDNILHLAFMGGDRETVKFVLSLDRVDINSRGRGSWTPVMAAARRGHSDVVELLVSQGADVSLVEDDGNNILHWACMGGDRKTVDVVLSLGGVDVNARNNDGETAADVARLWGHHQLSDLLVSQSEVKVVLM